jgi:cobalamin biosynthesis Mg chelatase CobN
VLLVAVLAATSYLVWKAPDALAACHSFSVSASPETVAEGDAITVTVKRDGQVLPSSVDVTTVNDSAKSGEDFDGGTTKVTFANGTEQSFKLSTKDDANPEANEKFKLHLSNGAGCTPGVTFAYGADEILTIQDNDAAASNQGTQAQASSPQSPAASPTAAPGEEAAAAGEAGSGVLDLSPTPAVQASSDEPKGRSGVLIVVAIGVLLAAGAGAGLWFLRRTPA